MKDKLVFRYPFNQTTIKTAKAIMVHTDSLKKTVLRVNPNSLVRVIRHGSEFIKFNKTRTQIRKELGIKSDFVVCSFGSIQKHKGLENALRAFSKTKGGMYVLCGNVDNEFDIDSLINKLKIRDRVKVTGFIERKQALKYIYASNVCINLRTKSTGATSGGLINILACGRLSIVSPLKENEEFPENCVFRAKNEKDIFEYLELIKNTPSLELEMSKNALIFSRDRLWKIIIIDIKNFITSVYEGKK